MGDERGPLPKKRRRIPLWAKIAMGVVIALVAVIASPRIYYGIRVWQELRRIRAEGYPTSWDEIQSKIPDPPPDQNAALVLAQAFALIVEPADNKSVQLLGRDNYRIQGVVDRRMPDEATRQAMAACLRDNAAALSLIRKALSMPGCKYASVVRGDGSVGPSPTILLGTMKAERLTCLEAIYNAGGGDMAGAAKSLMLHIGLAHSLAEEPATNAQGIREVICGISMLNLQRFMTLRKLPDADAVALSQALRSESEGREQTLALSFAWKVCCSKARLDRSENNASWKFAPRASGLSWLPRVVKRLTGMAAGDNWAYLRAERSSIEAARLPYPARLAALKAIRDSVENLPDVREFARNSSPSDYLDAEDEAETIAKLRSGRAALAVDRYRQAKGGLPDSLDDLVPAYLDAVPIDPCDGKPLKYKKLEVGFMVYSVGKDGIDNGGAPYNQDWESPDLPFTVGR